jgi:collagenase-like PrtC family protease
MKSDPSIRPKILAPVSALDEVAILAEAGADEIYCGCLPADWAKDYGASDTLTRRQGTVANFGTLREILSVPQVAARLHLRCALTLNVAYTRDQTPRAMHVAEQWREAGGHAIIVSDVEFLLNLQQRGLPIERHLSILAGVFNSQAVSFFRTLGVSRIVLPRSLSIDEMARIARHHAGFEFGAIILNEKCEFIDGLCGFYHGTAFPPGTVSCFEYRECPGGNVPRTFSHDPAYVGHGCQIPFVADACGAIEHADRDDEHRPACGACVIPGLAEAGIHYLKIAGRGLPSDLKLRAVRFIRSSVDASIANHDQPRRPSVALKRLYSRTFGCSCDSTSCYYSHGQEGM